MDHAASLRTVTAQFPALGTSVEVGLRAPADQTNATVHELQNRVADFEARFSRFRPTAELSALNRGAGQRFAASKSLVEILAAACRMWVQTNGLVDPTVGNAVRAAGYVASFEKLLHDSPEPPAGEPLPMVTFADVKLDDQTGTVELPVGAALDLGGVGKGFLADQLRSLLAASTPNYWLSLGGDMVGAGAGDDEQLWPVAVQDPRQLDRDLGTLRLPGAWAVATSGTTKRHGTRGSKAWHHLIDPRTQQPAQTDVIGVTVVAPSALDADAFAKTVLLMGSAAGLAWLAEQPSCHAIVTTAAGVTLSPGMRQFFTAV